MTYGEYILACRRHYLRTALEAAGGNVRQAAELAGCNRTDLYKILKRYGIVRSRPRNDGGAPRLMLVKDIAPLEVHL